MPFLLVLWFFFPFTALFWIWEPWISYTLVAMPFIYLAASSLIHRIRFGKEPSGPVYGPPTYVQYAMRQALQGVS